MSISKSTVQSTIARVPEVTLWFWIIKVLSTTVGETFADFLNTNLNMGLTNTSLILSGFLAVALVFQFRARRYVPYIYWVVVVLISVVGTLITDNLTDHFHTSLVTSSVIFGVALALVFALWFREEKTLAMKSITNFRREAWYWTAILFTFALGTATGDLFAEKVNFGYGYSLLFFVGLIGAVYALWRAKVIGDVLAFWLAYILTRPLVASVGDFLAQPKNIGGNGLGTTITSIIFLGVIAVVVTYLALTRSDQLVVATSAEGSKK
jgi:uncharacterized membrane-anchored protein